MITTIKTMNEGIVKFFNTSMGFDFIKPTDSSEDIFVHGKWTEQRNT